MLKISKKLFILIIWLCPFYSSGQNDNYVKGELLIQISPEAEPFVLARKIESEHNLVVKEIICLSDIMNIYQFRFNDSAVNLTEVQRICLTYSEVLVVQKNHYVFERETIPSDTLFDNLWHLKNTGQTGGVVDADIDAPDAWDITTGGLTTHNDTIVVCIIEGNGVDINHVDIKDNHWKNYGEIQNDGIDNDNNGYIDDFNGWNVISTDDAIGAGSHGTRVAGMIGATGNNITGVVGVNWKVKLMVVQGQQASNEASVIAAYSYPLKMRKLYNDSYGQEGAFVVATNSSWGIDNGDPADSPLWCAMYDSLGYYGILNVAATTNSSYNIDVVGDLPTTCASEFLIAVTMTNSQDLIAGSGYGPINVDLGAPGSLVQSTSPGNTYSTVSGTSFASPCVAGCVALAYSAPCAEFINFVKYDPAQASLDMRQYILSSVDVVPGLMADVASGGRMNIKNAIDSIIASCDPNLCVPPYNLIAANITDSVADISWSGFSADYVFYLQEGSSAPVEIGVFGASSISFDTLTPCTWYTILIKSDCGTDSSNYSFPLVFQTDGCCENPLLILDSKTKNSITLSWPPVLYSTNYDLRYKVSSESVWTEVLNVTSPYIFSGLTPCTEYDFQIHTTCTDSTHGYSSTQAFLTLGCGACTEQTYCSVAGANSGAEWIAGITINGFSNTTGNDLGWLQSNQIITALTPGISYNVTLIPGYSGFNFTEEFSVWIDFDQDGIFEASEIVINNQSTNTTLLSSILIPSGAPIGITKMRIGMSAGTAPAICPSSSFYGEYEDYCVYIGPQSGIEENNLTLSIYPNPVTDELFIQFSETIPEIRIFDSSGREVIRLLNYNGAPIQTAGLSNGLYIIEVKTNDAIYKTKFVKN